MSVIVRTAQREELTWVNTQYDRVGFKHSAFDNETILIAELNGTRVGLGRLQLVAQNSVELGGIFVDERSRRLGVAAQIVECLLAQALGYSTVYCLPFLHLRDFYQTFGFELLDDLAAVPPAISEKLCWCNESYESETLLMVLNKTLAKQA